MLPDKKKKQTTQLLIIWTGNLEYIESEHFYYHFINIPVFSPPILTCKERPAHENGSLKELNGVITWASGSLALKCNLQWRRWKMWQWRRWHSAMLWFPKGAARKTPRWGRRGRRPWEGEEAEGHPSLILFYYSICAPDPKLVCLKIVTGLPI